MNGKRDSKKKRRKKQAWVPHLKQVNKQSHADHKLMGFMRESGKRDNECMNDSRISVAALKVTPKQSISSQLSSIGLTGTMVRVTRDRQDGG